MEQICSIRGTPILLNPDNHFTERNMSNLLDSKFSQRKTNELLIRFTVRNPCFTRYARNVSFIIHSTPLHSICSSPLYFLWTPLYKSQVANITHEQDILKLH